MGWDTLHSTHTHTHGHNTNYTQLTCTTRRPVESVCGRQVLLFYADSDDDNDPLSGARARSRSSIYIYIYINRGWPTTDRCDGRFIDQPSVRQRDTL